MMKSRMTALGLAALLAVSFGACGENAEADTPALTTSPQAAPSEQEAETTEDNSNTALITRQMQGVDLEGREFRILGSIYTDAVTGSEYNEIWFEEENGEPLQDAVFTRNRRTEELLNITIKPMFLSDATSVIGKSVMAGDNEYDVAIGPLMQLGDNARKGLFRNYYKISTMDVTQPWWDSNLVNNFSLRHNKLYFINGDITLRDDYAECVDFFNKAIVADYGFDNPYDLVDAGTWTIDAMMSMVNSFTHDLNGDGKLDIKNDAFGYGDNGGLIHHLIFSIGEKITDVNEEGLPVMAEMTDSHVSKIEKLYNTVAKSPNVYMGDNVQIANALIEGRVFIYIECLGAYSEFRDMEDDFGVLPCPKYDEAQERYGSYISNGWNTAYVVPVTNMDEATGTIMETMGALSTDTIQSTLYDVLFTVKYARDEQTARMIDYIVDSKVYDWSTDFGWLSALTGPYGNLAKAKTFDFVSKIEKVKDKVAVNLEKLIADFDAAE